MKNNWKKLYESNIFTIDSIECAIDNIIKGIKNNDIIAIVIQIGGNEHIYNLTSNIFICNDDTSKSNAISIVKSRIDVFLVKYHIENVENVIIRGRIHLSPKDYSEIKDKSVRNKIISELRKIQERFNSYSKMNIINTTDALRMKNTFNEIIKTVSKGVLIDSCLYLHNNIYKLQDPSIKITEFKDDSITCSNYTKSFSITIDKDNKIFTWIDHHYKDDIIHRIYNNDLYIFQNSVIIDFKLHYKFPSLRKPIVKNDTINNNVGVIDIETYKDITNENNIEPYACGFKTKDKNIIFYGTNCIIDIITVILTDYNNYTFYTHNLDFDGPYILKAITILIDNASTTIKVIIKDNKDIITISTPTIKILDSIKILPFSLAKLARDFNLPHAKTNFPYKFITSDTINYIGPKPLISDYEDLNGKTTITGIDYNKLPSLFNVEIETLNYLNNDLVILYEIVTKMQNIIYTNYNIDITKSVSISAFSYRLYIGKYYKPSYDIKGITSQINYDISQAHFGGISMIYKRIVTNAYYYDINSQYPAAMRNPIPIGNPTLVTNVDIVTIFGYFYVVMQPTDKFNQFIPVRTSVGTIEYPIEDIRGWYFSEEIKEIARIGWLIDVQYGYQFDSKINIFTKFVEDLYNQRQTAIINSNTTISILLKLIINSLYGRIAFIQPTTQTRIIPISKTNYYSNKFIIIEVIALNDKFNLIQYETKSTNNTIQQLLKIENPTSIDNVNYNNNNNKKTISYTNSSIPIAAAIASYARISIIPFKTDPTNQPFYTDTDSIVIEKKIDNFYVSDTIIGKIKTPLLIETGIFLKQKVYSLKLKDGSVITKTAGFNSNLLTFDIFTILAKGEIIEINGYKITTDFTTLTKKIYDTKYKLHYPINLIYTIIIIIYLSFNTKYNYYYIQTILFIK